MTMLTYSFVAIVFLLLVISLVRKSRSLETEELYAERLKSPSVVNRRWVDLSERIFDPSDVRWLAEELAFPALAKSLTLARKRLAIRWLEALQASFDDLVRTPALTSDQPSEALASWKMLWLTIRFKALVSYALLVVKFFGPYHRLIPSFSWIPLPSADERSFRRTVLADSQSSN
jgi:hypothetical protein